MQDLRTKPFVHPLHAILLGFPIALFSATIASDLAYLNTAEMQWSNFSAWLNAGGMVFGALVLLWAIIATFRASQRGRALIHLLLLAAMCVVGLFNAFHHSQDAWSSVGTTGLVLSIVTALLALAAGWVAFGGRIAR